MLNDQQMEALAGLLMTRTALNRLARSEVIASLRFMEGNGYGISDTTGERKVLTAALRPTEYDPMFTTYQAIGNRENVNG